MKRINLIMLIIIVIIASRTFKKNIKQLHYDNINIAKTKQYIKKTKQYIKKYLNPVINKTGEHLEGNIFTIGKIDFSFLFHRKCVNISLLSQNKDIKNIMEIGFNAGFSTLLMLFSNPLAKITCYDLGEHSYTMPCFKIIKKTFGDRVNLILGDSTKTVPNDKNKYDLIHIDGGHSTYVATQDIENSYNKSKPGTIFIFDDYILFPNLHILWNSYIRKYSLKNLDSTLYLKTIHHDIKKRN
jgi:predicted O-methyltransferase YrrM